MTSALVCLEFLVKRPSWQPSDRSQIVKTCKNPKGCFWKRRIRVQKQRTHWSWLKFVSFGDVWSFPIHHYFGWMNLEFFPRISVNKWKGFLWTFNLMRWAFQQFPMHHPNLTQTNRICCLSGWQLTFRWVSSSRTLYIRSVWWLCFARWLAETHGNSVSGARCSQGCHWGSSKCMDGSIRFTSMRVLW